MRLLLIPPLFFLLGLNILFARISDPEKQKLEIKPNANLYILSIGIDDYSLFDMHLLGCANDVRMLPDTLSIRFKEIMPDIENRVHIWRLIDKDATRQNIISTLRGCFEMYGK